MYLLIMVNTQSGFGNTFSTEAIAGTLPLQQNSPQKTPLGLYPEQISGSAFTAPRHENLRTWMYRTLPSVVQGNFGPTRPAPHWKSSPAEDIEFVPHPLRWAPVPSPSAPTDWIEGMHTQVLNGDLRSQIGCATHIYSCNRSMKDRYFYNSDGELLIVPEQGALRLHTELGILEIEPLEIAVIPRGIRFRVELLGPTARGYVCENYGAPFRLPSLGVIGSNGLAHPRHFFYPVAAFESQTGDFEILTKFAGRFFKSSLRHSPLNVVAWYGNYAPYKYDLRQFNTINTVSYDHPDPSIFTVLTSPSDTPGMANVDFVIFPPRWMVAENTFRPPYYHRNVMSEYMGLLTGVYDAKEEGFVPGGGSLHNCMTGHGPDAVTFEKATTAELKPQKIEHTMAIMIESRYAFGVPFEVLNSSRLQTDYSQCWQPLKPTPV